MRYGDKLHSTKIDGNYNNTNIHDTSKYYDDNQKDALVVERITEEPLFSCKPVTISFDQ